jgi:hypothetical protein
MNLELSNPFVLTTGTVVSLLFAGNIFWIRKALTKIDHIDNLVPLVGKVKALEELVINLSRDVSRLEGYLHGMKGNAGNKR